MSVCYEILDAAFLVQGNRDGCFGCGCLRGEVFGMQVNVVL